MATKQERTRQKYFLCFMLVVAIHLLMLCNSPTVVFFATSLDHSSNNDVMNKTKAMESNRQGRRCALNLFGLPRSFQDLVLPALTQNVIVPNIQYDCDYFVHTYNVTYEPPSRSGQGGPIIPETVFLLRDTVHRIASQAGRPQLPHVGFTFSTEEEFELKHAELLAKIRRRGGKNRYTWKKDGFTLDTNVNVIKMWHSVSSVWDLMKTYASFGPIRYDRVAMLRSDVVFVTPIDIFRSASDGMFDTFNNHSVIPGFAQCPVNDRMFYGPYKAAEIWAAGRFPRLYDYIHRLWRPLHPERFLKIALLPAIRALSISVDEDPALCFWRARADKSIWVDCGDHELKSLLEDILNRSCSLTPANISEIWEPLPVLNCSL
jgi:hypothetical protein